MDPLDVDVKVLRLQPGDVVALIAKRVMTTEQATTLRDRWKERFPSVPAVVIDGFGLVVIRPNVGVQDHPEGD